MILCFIIYQYTNSVFLKFILSFVLKHFFPRTIWNRSKRKPLPVSYAHSCSSCKFFPYPDIFSLKWFVCVFFFSSSPLIQNKFGVKHWLGPLSEAAEGGWNSVSPSSGFCSKCTSLFDVTQLLGRLLSLFHHCGYCDKWEEQSGFVQRPCFGYFLKYFFGLKIPRRLPL